MKVCSVCGCHNADGAEVCSVCGVFFPKEDLPKESFPTAVLLNPTPKPVLQLQENAEDQKSDRMALAGFILSLMGAATCMTSPLQLAALILSLSAGKTKKFRTLRSVGIVLSSVALGLSLIVWLIVGINADTVFTYLNDAMNEFYY